MKDVNEAPTVTANKTTVYLTDGTIANTTTVAVVEGMDVDENSTFTYSITGGNTNSDFAIDSNTGQITVANTLDRSSTSSYTLTVTVTDNGNLTATIEITVNVTDAANTAPTFADAARSIAENALPGANVGTPVMGMDNENDALTYAIIDGNDGDVFAIDNNGQITVAAGKKLNHEIKGTYILTVTATDAGSGTAVPATVTVTVTDVDEDSENMAPTFANASRTIAENAAAESNVGNPVTAADPENDALTYSIKSGNDAGNFEIDTNGQITVKNSADLDHEATSSYMLTVTATDPEGSGTTVESMVTITVTDLNEAPKIGTIPNNLTVAEDASSGDNVGTSIMITDEDRPAQTLTYALTGANASDFIIEGGQIKVSGTASLDASSKASYSLTLTVTDDGAGRLSDEESITITVTPAGATNQAPTFNEGPSAMRAVAENTTSGNVGTPVAATDNEEDDITYSIKSGNEEDNFDINSRTGQITVKNTASLDYEETEMYMLVLTAADASGSDEITVTINVTNVNDNPPVLTDMQFTISQSDDATGGYELTTLSNADEDGDLLTYKIISGRKKWFAITANKLIINEGFSAVSRDPGLFTVTIEVSDGMSQDTAIITVNVPDADEDSGGNMTPTFTSTGGTSATVLAENVGSGANVRQFTATPNDAGQTVTYSLKGTNADDFSINSMNGQITVGSSGLDFETTSSYSLTVVATDNGTPPAEVESTFSITVNDVNEFSPMFSSGTSADVPENTTTVLTVRADDADGTASIEYSVSGGEDRSLFQIDSDNGQLTFIAAPDYENPGDAGTNNMYEVVVTASDGDNNTTQTITVSVTDVNEAGATNQAPVFDEDSPTRSVAENSGVGTNVGTAVTASDNEDDNITYGIKGTDSNFEINSSSGQITVKRGASLDHEATSSYTLTVTAMDDGSSTTVESMVTITVTDVNEAPTITASTARNFSVAADATASTSVGTPIAATDPDAGQMLDYELSGTGADNFDINNNTGQIAVANSASLSVGRYALTLTVTDNADTPLSSQPVAINITVNAATPTNNAPMFANASRAVAEDAAGRSTVGAPVMGTDPDRDDLTYTITGGNTGDVFAINDNGQITIAAGESLDHENTPVYTLTVRASDGKGGTADATITINVTDVNDEKPVITSRNVARVPENTTAVLTVTATDADGTGEIITYSITGGGDRTKFDIGRTSGDLTFKEAPDFEARGSNLGSNTYYVQVTATDGTNNSSWQGINVIVTNVTERPTLVLASGSSSTVSLPDGTAANTAVAAVEGSHDDATISTYTYSITGGNTNNDFKINNTGAITVAKTLNRSATPNYTLTVTVTDRLNQTASITITVSVTAVDPPSPETVMLPTVSLPDAGTAVDHDGNKVGLLARNATDAADITLTATGGSAELERQKWYVQVKEDRDNIISSVTPNAGAAKLFGDRTLSITGTDKSEATGYGFYEATIQVFFDYGTPDTKDEADREVFEFKVLQPKASGILFVKNSFGGPTIPEGVTITEEDTETNAPKVTIDFPSDAKLPVVIEFLIWSVGLTGEQIDQGIKGAKVSSGSLSDDGFVFYSDELSNNSKELSYDPKYYPYRVFHPTIMKDRFDGTDVLNPRVNELALQKIRNNRFRCIFLPYKGTIDRGHLFVFQNPVEPQGSFHLTFRQKAPEE
ncbi:MAG: cadherin repeat domain-containing protein [Ekhidna sp.]|nr:cadherin repeat domain-containing protein [Ekhidna sp.]